MAAVPRGGVEPGPSGRYGEGGGEAGAGKGRLQKKKAQVIKKT
tara:strand:+ start:1085 stop:1213 length:129 start_codon:yes stop_codon:yes gene_type:complete